MNIHEIKNQQEKELYRAIIFGNLEDARKAKKALEETYKKMNLKVNKSE